MTVAGCANLATPQTLPATRSIANGPASDYPVTIGAPYVVGETTYIPLDTMNFDQVGYAAFDPVDEAGVTAAHHILPLPSYIEVTALDTGKTILVRVERRGPMDNTRAVALSRDAMAQLEAADGAPVRVRRVNPPEEDRADLRADRAAAERMATPKSLLEVLRRRLPGSGSVTLTDPRQAVVSGRAPDAGMLASLDPIPAQRPAQAQTSSPPSAHMAASEVALAPAAKAATSGKFMVQLGTFADHANAERLAAKTEGKVTMSGRFALVRVGPFANRGQAEEALAKLRRQGYSDASIRILR